jgi:16S rRNA (adenine1518-N6/adenine1519-N6)-dimethyltransferase
LPPVRKSLGQHFLTDRKILERIVDAIEMAPEETVVEVGAGRGSLTEILKPRARRVIAIEYDRALAAILRERYAGSNVEIVEADVLQTDIGRIAGGPYALVGNVPYYITTPILFHTMQPPRPTRSVFLVQREVADRMSAAPGSKTYGALSVNLQALATTESLFRVAPGAFKPVPKVESSVVRVVPRANPVIKPGEQAPFREFVQAIFSKRRKQMRRVIRSLRPISAEAADALLEGIGIPPGARPETLDPESFVRLLRAFG